MWDQGYWVCGSVHPGQTGTLWSKYMTRIRCFWSLGNKKKYGKIESVKNIRHADERSGANASNNVSIKVFKPLWGWQVHHLSRVYGH